MRCDIPNSTFHAAVNMMDFYVHKAPVSSDTYPLVAFAALYLAVSLRSPEKLSRFLPILYELRDKFGPDQVFLVSN